MTPKEWFLAFALTVTVVGAGWWAWIIDERTESIRTIAESAARIEEVAANTEDMLADTLAERATPEALAERQAVRQAVRDIATIRELICDLPELADHDGCE